MMTGVCYVILLCVYNVFVLLSVMYLCVCVGLRHDALMSYMMYCMCNFVIR